MTLKLIDKLDSLIFERFNPAHEPVTGATVAITFMTGLILGLVVLVSQLCGLSNDTIGIILGIAIVGLLIFVCYMTYPSVLSFESWGARIGYCLYTLGLFALSLYLSIWAFFLAFAAALFYAVVKLFFSNDNSKKAKIHYSDGSEEDADVEIGLLGEKYYKGKKTGNTIEKTW